MIYYNTTDETPTDKDGHEGVIEVPAGEGNFHVILEFVERGHSLRLEFLEPGAGSVVQTGGRLRRPGVRNIYLVYKVNSKQGSGLVYWRYSEQDKKQFYRHP